MYNCEFPMHSSVLSLFHSAISDNCVWCRKYVFTHPLGYLCCSDKRSGYRTQWGLQIKICQHQFVGQSSQEWRLTTCWQRAFAGRYSVCFESYSRLSLFISYAFLIYSRLFWRAAGTTTYRLHCGAHSENSQVDPAKSATKEHLKWKMLPL